MPENPTLTKINELSLTVQQHARSARNLIDVMDNELDALNTNDKEARNDAESKLITLMQLARESASKARDIGEEIESMTIQARAEGASA